MRPGSIVWSVTPAVIYDGLPWSAAARRCWVEGERDADEAMIVVSSARSPRGNLVLLVCASGGRVGWVRAGNDLVVA